MTHKEIKRDISNKLESSLQELKAILGDKKFNNRIKKATKILAEGIGKEEKSTTKATALKKGLEPKVSVKEVTKNGAQKTTKTIAKKAKAPLAKKTTKAPVIRKKAVIKK